MTSISETLFDTYGDSLMQEYAPYDEAEILAALDRMSMPQDMQIQLLSPLGHSCLRHRPGAGPLADAGLLRSPSTDLTDSPVRRRSSCIRG